MIRTANASAISRLLGTKFVRSEWHASRAVRGYGRATTGFKVSKGERGTVRVEAYSPLTNADAKRANETTMAEEYAALLETTGKYIVVRGGTYLTVSLRTEEPAAPAQEPAAETPEDAPAAAPRSYAVKGVGARVSNRLRRAGVNVSPAARRFRAQGIFVTAAEDHVTVAVDLRVAAARNADWIARIVAGWGVGDIRTYTAEDGNVLMSFTYPAA